MNNRHSVSLNHGSAGFRLVLLIRGVTTGFNASQPHGLSRDAVSGRSRGTRAEMPGVQMRLVWNAVTPWLQSGRLVRRH